MIFLYATRHFLLFICMGLFILFYILLASNYENNFIIFCFISPFLIRTTIIKNHMNRWVDTE